MGSPSELDVYRYILDEKWESSSTPSVKINCSLIICDTAIVQVPPAIHGGAGLSLPASVAPRSPHRQSFVSGFFVVSRSWFDSLHTIYSVTNG